MSISSNRVAAALLLAPIVATAQTLASGKATREPLSGGPPSATATSATATRAAKSPVIDGKGDDAVWTTAQVIDSFRTFDPVENGDPRFRTETRVAYDERNLFVLVRAFDPHPDSIIALLSRRDVRTQSDWLKIVIDAYHDRRTGVEFAVNPAGVKRDYAIINDGEEDESWDAVWDVATRIDSAGWVAEYRVPLNQLRYASAPTHVFGFAVWRDVARFNERYSWPLYSRSKGGLSSQLGEVTGIEGIASPRRMELAPYSVARTTNAPVANGFAQRSEARVGADLKYGITSNLTLDGTVNPDFGQVEADPSVLNLSAFETFFPEKRPFFLEGQGLFRFDTQCNDGVCSGLFYSRRIGRQPQLSGTYEETGNATNSTILGAAKLTGRLANGFSVGILDAVTQAERSPTRKTIEPQTNYFVGRMQRDFRQGASGIGLMLTNVRRNLDAWSRDYLRSDAYTGGVDFRHEFLQRNYAVSAYYAMSDVRGSAAAIARTQLSSVHNYQRPDDNQAFDSTRTSLGGYSAQFSVQKRGGGRTRGSTGVQLLSPGFEVNDVGFLSRASAKNQWLWFQVQQTKPGSFYRYWNYNINQWTNWAWDNTRTELGGNVNAHMQLKNSMWLHIGQGVNAAVPSFCDNCTRGGPAVRQERSFWGWGGIEGDPRPVFVPFFFVNWSRGDAGRSYNWNLSPSLDYRLSSRFTASLSYNYGRGVNASQFNGNFGDVGSDTTHYTVARLDQTTHAMTARMSFTATPTLSLQVYAQPFSTRGTYSDWLEVANARADQWSSRYRPYAGGDPGAFDFKQYRSNTVMRWEYRPGSTLFLVWAQERTQSLDGDAARRSAGGIEELRRAHPQNVFLIKGSYWVSY